MTAAATPPRPQSVAAEGEQNCTSPLVQREEYVCFAHAFVHGAAVFIRSFRQGGFVAPVATPELSAAQRGRIERNKQAAAERRAQVLYVSA